MKPRIFVNMHYMALGGAERALLGLLNALDPMRVDVDLMLNQHTGEFMPLIPEYVRLLPEQRGYNAIERPMRDIVREGQWRIALARLHAKWQHRCYLKTLTAEQRAYDASIFQYVADCVTPVLPPIAESNTPYDLAISFLTPHNIVLDKVKARKKIAWIHTDYSTIHVNVEKELRVWSRYDYITSISDDCTRSFLQTFPSLKDKIILIENILSPSLVRRQAMDDAHFDAAPIGSADSEGTQTPPLTPPLCERGGEVETLSECNAGEQTPPLAPPLCERGGEVMLLSVGRISHAKNYDNIPDIARRMREMGLNFVWYILGPGNHDAIDQKIAETGTGDSVKLLGATSNPYPYIKACDIYVQPSRYEGKSVTVREAQILCKPVIITDYPTARSQVQDGVDGIICPMDNAGIARAICDLAGDATKRKALSAYLAAHDYGNEREVEKIYGLIQRRQSSMASV